MKRRHRAQFPRCEHPPAPEQVGGRGSSSGKAGLSHFRRCRSHTQVDSVNSRRAFEQGVALQIDPGLQREAPRPRRQFSDAPIEP